MIAKTSLVEAIIYIFEPEWKKEWSGRRVGEGTVLTCILSCINKYHRENFFINLKELGDKRVTEWSVVG